MSHVTAGGAALVGTTETAVEEFRVFYAAQFGPVAGYAYKLTQDEELARDLAQEAFTRLLSRWVRVREPRAYLFHTVTNLVRDTWRAGRRDAELLDALVPVAEVAGPDRTVADAVSRLPERQREVVLLYYYADLPVPEVAAAVRMPAGTVKWLLSQARERLARVLGGPE